jgi:nucleolar complex protein 3
MYRSDYFFQHTETLKLLFVLYFSILKAAKPSPLLFDALQGIARFSHMVNVDFFRDLLAVIRDIMRRNDEHDEDVDVSGGTDGSFGDDQSRMRLQILCIVTAFDLLSGQGKHDN